MLKLLKHPRFGTLRKFLGFLDSRQHTIGGYQLCIRLLVIILGCMLDNVGLGIRLGFRMGTIWVSTSRMVG